MGLFVQIAIKKSHMRVLHLLNLYITIIRVLHFLRSTASEQLKHLHIPSTTSYPPTSGLQTHFADLTTHGNFGEHVAAHSTPASFDSSISHVQLPSKQFKLVVHLHVQPLPCPVLDRLFKGSYVISSTPLPARFIYRNSFPIQFLQRQLLVGEEGSGPYRFRLRTRSKEGQAEFIRGEKYKSAERIPPLSVHRYLQRTPSVIQRFFPTICLHIVCPGRYRARALCSWISCCNIRGW
jgi:hypothetical protein